MTKRRFLSLLFGAAGARFVLTRRSAAGGVVVVDGWVLRRDDV